MTLTEHLTELRRRIIVSLVAFVAVSTAAFFAFNPLMDVLLHPLCSLPHDVLGPSGCRLNVLGVVEPFTVRLKVTVMAALIGSSPIWLYEAWAFLVPGLTEREQRRIAPLVAVSLLLFVIGALFAYTTLPFGLRFLLGIGGPDLLPLVRADSYINFVGFMTLAFGVTFEVPLVLFALGLLGVVDAALLGRYRRYAIVAIFLLAAVVTPSQDPYTMTVMAVPLYLLYEGAILALRVVARRDAAPRG